MARAPKGGSMAASCAFSITSSKIDVMVVLLPAGIIGIILACVWDRFVTRAMTVAALDARGVLFEVSRITRAVTVLALLARLIGKGAVMIRLCASCWVVAAHESIFGLLALLRKYLNAPNWIILVLRRI
jgi:hypothetical protein